MKSLFLLGSDRPRRASMNVAHARLFLRPFRSYRNLSVAEQKRLNEFSAFHLVYRVLNAVLFARHYLSNNFTFPSVALIWRGSTDSRLGAAEYAQVSAAALLVFRQ